MKRVLEKNCWKITTKKDYGCYMLPNVKAQEKYSIDVLKAQA